MEQSTPLSKAYILIFMRFLILVLCMFALFLQNADSLPSILGINEAKILMGMFIVNMLYVLIARFLNNHVAGFLLFQISVDLLAVTWLVYVSGGILSIFASLYFGIILSAGICLHSNLSIFYASLSTISIAGVAFIYFIAALTKNALPWVKAPEGIILLDHDIMFLRSYLFAQGVSFHLVALFIRWLSDLLNQQHIMHAEILENLNEGVIVMDERLILDFINVKAKMILGIDINTPCIDCSIKQLLDTSKHTAILKAILLQKPCHFQSEIESHGALLPISITLTTFATSKKIRASLLILRDMSDQKHIEEAMKLVHRLETISEVAYTIAHEIRNPLASIRGAVQELNKEGLSSESRTLLTDIAIRESDRLNRIITDFLQLSKLRQPAFQEIHLSHLMQEFLYFLQKRPDMSNAQITMDVPDNITLQGDPEQLKQVFYNLTINALEAAKGPLQLAIKATLCMLKDFPHNSRYSFYGLQEMGVTISFCDQGHGIAPQNLKKIFTPFFSTKKQGSGMGLAMVNKIVSSHQGICHVTSETGQGTTFSVWLPQKIG